MQGTLDLLSMRWPRWLVALPVRVRTLLLPGRAERDLEDELALHLERQAEANRQSGRDDVDVRLLARRQFGGVEQSRERCRDQRPLRWLDELARDVHYALCTFRRSPRFVAAAVLVLVLGISANTTVFSLVNGMLFRPLPVPAPGELRYVHAEWDRNRALQKVPDATFRYLAEHNETFAGLATRASASVVAGLPSLDAPTLVVVTALLSGVILAAGLAPARRAPRANPIDVLRAP